MKQGARLVGYLVVTAVLAGLLAASPHAWATPEQSQSNQMTVPTRTPKPPSPVVQPTKIPPSATPVPPATAEPSPVPPGATGTSAPSVNGFPPPTSTTPAASLALVKEVAPLAAWPGATLNYTLTVTNEGTGSARQVVIEDPLPDGLDPGAIAPEINAAWDGRLLRAQAPLLPPGSQLVIVFSAVVQPSAKPGGVLANQASVLEAGGTSVSASAFVMLPPAELPPTGDSIQGGCEPASIER